MRILQGVGWYYPDSWGGTEIYVNSLGDVYPCKLVTGREHKAGNIRQAPLRELFASPVLADLRSNAVFAGENAG